MNIGKITLTCDIKKVECKDPVAGLLSVCYRCKQDDVGYIVTPRGYVPVCCYCGMEGPAFSDPLDMQKWWNK